MHTITAGILGSIGLTLLYFYIIKIPKIFNYYTGLKLVKPFSCSFCMSFWFCFFFMILKTDFISAIFISTITPFIYLNIEDYFINKFQL